MDAEQFVSGLKQERDAMLASYVGDPSTYVGGQLAAAKLSDEQRRLMAGALDAALTDAFYTILLALDGAASINGSQQHYRITDERGDDVSLGDGTLEALAFEHFQSEE